MNLTQIPSIVEHTCFLVDFVGAFDPGCPVARPLLTLGVIADCGADLVGQVLDLHDARHIDQLGAIHKSGNFDRLGVELNHCFVG